MQCCVKMGPKAGRRPATRRGGISALVAGALLVVPSCAPEHEEGDVRQVTARLDTCDPKLAVEADQCFLESKGLLLSASFDLGKCADVTSGAFKVRLTQSSGESGVLTRSFNSAAISAARANPVEKKVYLETLIDDRDLDQDGESDFDELKRAQGIGDVSYFFELFKPDGSDSGTSPDRVARRPASGMIAVHAAENPMAGTSGPATGEHAPTVGLTAPAEGQTVTASGTVDFVISASDGDDDLEQVELHLVDAAGVDRTLERWFKVGTENTFQFRYYAPQLPMGTYRAYADAYDRQGRRAPVQADRYRDVIIVRGEHPANPGPDWSQLESASRGFARAHFSTPYLLAPEPGVPQPQRRLQLDATLATDYQPDEANFHVAGPVLSDGTTQAPGFKDRKVKTFTGPNVDTQLTATYDMRQLPSGHYNVYFDMVKDGARSRSANHFLSLNVPTVQPVSSNPPVHNIYPATEQVLSGSTTLKARVSDQFAAASAGFYFTPAGGGARTAACQFGPGQTAIPNNRVYTCNYDASALSPGQYTFQFEAKTANHTTFATAGVAVRVARPWMRPRVMYDHDYSHIVNIASFAEGNRPARWQDKANRDEWPQHALLETEQEGFDIDRYRQMITDSFAELDAAGVDTVVFAPGTGEVPLWESQYYSAELHAALWQEYFGTPPNTGAPAMAHLLSGENALHDAQAAAEARGMQFYASYRMNDKHFAHADVETCADLPTFGEKASTFQNSSYFWLEQFCPTRAHDIQKPNEYKAIGEEDSGIKGSDYWLLPDYSACSAGNFAACLPNTELDLPAVSGLPTNPANPLRDAVRYHKSALIADLIANAGCGLDGLVLDFLRIPHLFHRSSSSTARLELMQGLLEEVRDNLDANSAACANKPQPLGVRVPYFAEDYDSLGIDLSQWALAGVDFFVFGNEREWAQPQVYRGGENSTETLIDFAAVKARAGAVSTFQQMDYGTQVRTVIRPTISSSGAEAGEAGEVFDCTHVPAMQRRTPESDTPYQPKLIHEHELEQGAEKWPSCSPTYTSRRRTSKEEMVSGAYAAFTRGADGVFLFNMPYYRGSDGVDPEQWSLPPFDVMRCLDRTFPGGSGNPEATWCDAETNGAHYFIADAYEIEDQPLKGRRPLPLDLPYGRLRDVTLYAPKPPDGWPAEMYLEVELEFGSDVDPIDVRLNGNFLGIGGADEAAWTPAEFEWITRTRSEDSGGDFYEMGCDIDGGCKFSCATGNAEQLRRYKVPSQYLRNGRNEISFKRTQDSARIQRVLRIDLTPLE